MNPYALPSPRLDQMGVSEEAVTRWGTEPVGPPTPDAVWVVTLGLHRRADGVRMYPGQGYWITSAAEAARQVSREAVHVPRVDDPRWWDRPGRVLSPFAEDTAESVHATTPTPGALRIVQGCGYDPGNAAYRFHSALNAASKHASAFVRFYDTNPHCSLRQVDGISEAWATRELVRTADVIHCHANYLLVNNSGMQPDPGQVLVMHYHGSQPDGSTLCEERMPGSGMPLLAWDHLRGARVVGARLSLVEEIRRVAERLSLPVDPGWVPIPVDVARYRALGAVPYAGGPFRLAHSPTVERFKGTAVLRRVVERLQAQGLPVELVLLRNLSHGDALRAKATCHATFDSFWLGMQGSGLEAAAMGLPVIAGDDDAAEAHVRFWGHLPWTFADDEAALSAQIERLVLDPAYYADEAARVARFVEANHDYPAVARRYEALLAQWTGRADVVTGVLAGGRTTSPLQASVPDGPASETPAPSPRTRRRRKAA